ncbi:MAG: HEPN domain-containing protein [Bacteroidetes bacterium]|nr:HEPN domain-containing protein [Bacteroidota bacterium]
MSFLRGRAQLRCEEYLNCTGRLDNWKSSDFKNFKLSKIHATQLSQDLLEDSIDLYFKGLLSLSEAINSISRFYYSWATVKLYYSVFYFIKATLASKGIALIRQKSLFYLFAREGKKPIKKNNKKYTSDHSGTINYYQDIFKNDFLLTNRIGDETVYEWLMKRREQVQYRERVFHEPNTPSFWNHIVKKINEISLNNIIQEYIDDNYILSFQEEHACLAVPIKRALLSQKDLEDAGLKTSLNKDQKKRIINLLIVNKKPLPIIQTLKI